jgi:hypothetical protein
MEQITTVAGVLGAFFAVVLALAISVETILEPLTSLKIFRKRLSPDEVLADIKGWLPPIADGGARAAALANLSYQYGLKLVDLHRRLNTIRVVADETAKGLGVQKHVDDTEKKIAVYMAALREKYAVGESKRISLLRVIAALIGVAIALVLRVNTFDILGSLLPEHVRLLFSEHPGPLGGMIITGLAASAGSSFWHDQLGRLRAIKDAARSAG